MKVLEPTINFMPEKKFVGKNTTMSFSKNTTSDLWKRFMPVQPDIKHTEGIELYSIERYDQTFFNSFQPDANFEKWAAVEVNYFEDVPENLATLVTPGGMYAVFTYHGSSRNGAKFYDMIFNHWLPNSVYELDNRPHFAVMGEKYKTNDPNSEEEIWIPVKHAEYH